MTGREAWDLIFPYINPLKNRQFNNSDMIDAYVTIYIALKEYDEKENKIKKIH